MSSSLLTEQQRAQSELEQRKVYELYKADQRQSDISDYQLRLMAVADVVNRAVSNDISKTKVLVTDTTVQGTRNVGDNNPKLAEKTKKEKRRRRLWIGLAVSLGSLLLLLFVFLWRKYRKNHNTDTQAFSNLPDNDYPPVEGNNIARSQYASWMNPPQ
eukprot:jgi/Mesvir1/14783/Mv05423-RA.1